MQQNSRNGNRSKIMIIHYGVMRSKNNPLNIHLNLPIYVYTHFNCALSGSKRSMNRVIEVQSVRLEISCLKSIYQLSI